MLSADPSRGEIGFSGTLGGGLFVNSDKDAYFDTSVDIYPEIGLHVHFAPIALGFRAGFIWRKYTLEAWDYWDYWEYDYWSVEYTRSYIPAQLELRIAPLRGDFSPYVGAMIGAFIPVGDNDDTRIAISAVLGGEFKLSPLYLYGDLRYTYAYAGEYHVKNVGGFMAVFGVGLYLGFGD